MKDIADFLEQMYAFGFCDLGIHPALADTGADGLTDLKHGDAHYDSPDFSKRIDTLTPEVREIVKKVQAYLSANVLGNISHVIHFNDIWQGIADNVIDFHCDYDEHNPSFNASINVYLDDCDESTGGSLQTGYFDTILGEIYPKKFHVIAINQSPDREHRATPCNKLRRLISFRLSYERKLVVNKDSHATAQLST